jgi:hypothetical protein
VREKGKDFKKERVAERKRVRDRVEDNLLSILSSALLLWLCISVCQRNPKKEVAKRKRDSDLCVYVSSAFRLTDSSLK